MSAYRPTPEQMAELRERFLRDTTDGMVAITRPKLHAAWQDIHNLLAEVDAANARIAELEAELEKTRGELVALNDFAFGTSAAQDESLPAKPDAEPITGGQESSVAPGQILVVGTPEWARYLAMEYGHCVKHPGTPTYRWYNECYQFWDGSRWLVHVAMTPLQQFPTGWTVVPNPAPTR
jgi:hypothetical protein